MVPLLLQEGRDFAEQEAELLIQDHGERDHLRAELRTRGAERIRGLQRMTALHAAAARAALADVNTELAHDDARDRQFF